MSKYTTEVRYICETAYGLKKSVGADRVDEVINGALSEVFDFDFPIFDEEYRGVLESKILKHYYTREIGFETVGLWKLKLNTKLNEIMPYYNKLYRSELLEFNPLYSTNLTREHKTTVEGTRNENENENRNGSFNTSDNRNTIENGTSYNLYSDTPQGALNGVRDETYLTNATKNTIDNSSNNYGTQNGTTNDTRNKDNSARSNSVENYLETVTGYEGVDMSERVIKFRKTFLNIDMMIINDLEELFMQLW